MAGAGDKTRINGRINQRINELLALRVHPRLDPVIDRANRSTAWRAFNRYRAQRGSRLAAAITYSAFLSLFLSLFPLLVVSVAITAAVLGESGIEHLRERIQQNLPGIAGKVPLDGIVSNATTIGLVGGVSASRRRH